MATTTSTDVKIYNPQMQGAFIETIQQNVDAFNQASAGALAFNTRELRGQYEYEAFFDEVSSIARRDPSAESSSTVGATKLTQDEFIGVKLNRRNGPYEWNISSARLAGFDPVRFSIAVGEQTAVATPKEMIDRVLGAIEAKLDATTALEHDISSASPGTLTVSALNTGVSKFGDAFSRVRTFVMHSKPYFDLVGQQLTSSESVYASDMFGATLFRGTPATLGRPVLVIDSPSLVSETDISTGAPVYSTLGLTAGAGVIDLTEAPLAVAEGPITGSDNLFIRWQAEYSYNIKVKGCRYNTATGVNPTDANVATASNWVTAVSDNKLLPGVIVKTL
jgi:hypothetical protein